MSKITKFIGSLAGIFLTANSVLAADNITGNLGAASGIANDVMTYTKWGSIAIAIISLLILWASGNLARLSSKAGSYLNSKSHIQDWFKETLLVILGLVFIFGYVIPQ